MTDHNPRPPDSPDSDSTNQWSFELSDYLKLDDDQWQDDDDPESSFSGHVPNQDNQAHEVGDSAGSSSHLEGSSSTSNTNIYAKFLE